MLVNGTHYRTVWLDQQTVKMIDQTLIPYEFKIYECRNHRETARAISAMIIRGAGAIGAAAGYAMAQAALEAPSGNFHSYISEAKETIRKTRPTAQNLFFAVERVYKAIQNAPDEPTARGAAVTEAGINADEDALACKNIGERGAALIRNNSRILTHCNAGWLAFVDWGSALSPVYTAKRNGLNLFVWVDETRPRCQGARLTAWELKEENIAHAVIVDNAAGYYMRKREVDMVIVGSDRIALNGDAANKIGTYEKAVLAKENGIPFYVAAPGSTIDWDCPNGDHIPIEERSESEVIEVTGRDENGRLKSVHITPKGTNARNPAFDVTPAQYITGIITEKGIVLPGELSSLHG
jgi:methylthioribose-1-phosphate isomerase